MIVSQKFRCVALDAVGTVIFAEPSVAEAYTAIGQKFGSRLTVGDVGSRFREAFRKADAQASRWNGEIGATSEAHEREFWRSIVADVLPDVTDAEACFDELFSHFEQPSAWRCFDDVAPTLQELQRRGYALALASNFDDRLNRVCEGLRELSAIEQRVISSLVGFRKTHPGFFGALTSQVRCEPHEILMVGDDWENDVASAQRAGLTAIHLVRGNSTERQTGEIRSLTELLDLLP